MSTNLFVYFFIFRATYKNLTLECEARSLSAMRLPDVVGREQTPRWRRKNYLGCWRRGFRASGIRSVVAVGGEYTVGKAQTLIYWF